MKAYSQDLRERAASGCAEPGAKIYPVAVRFAASLSCTNKLLPRQRTSGRGAALPLHPGPAPLLDAAGDQRLRACLAAPPDATLAEISLALLAAGGPLPRRPAVWRATERLGWGRKKSVHAAERDPERVVALRRLFGETVHKADFTRFVFVDEMRLKPLGPVPTGPPAGVTAAPRGAGAWTRPCPCTAARTGRCWPRSPPTASQPC